jgi:excinuclease ABC subunit C
MQLNNLPSQPGVYFFKNKGGEIIYIGKSVNLKNRVRSYFQTKNLGRLTQKMVSEISKIDYQLCSSEFEALLLEARLISRYLPDYNIRGRDNKSFLMLIISQEKYPRLYTERQRNIKKLPSASRQTKNTYFGPFPSAGELKQVLKFIRKVFPFRSCKRLPKKPCLYYHLHLCPGCCLGINSYQYRRNVIRIKRFLNGQIKTVIKDLKKEMKKLSQQQKFEKAAQVLKQIEAIEYTITHWQSLNKDSLSLNLSKDEKDQVLVQAQKILHQLKKLNRIEAYDISNLQGLKATGSMVVFEKLKPAKDQYRRFKIRKPQIPDDPGMMAEVLQRRLKHKDWSKPDLILLDGGKGQVSAVYQVLQSIKLDKKVALLGLAKKEETLIKPLVKDGYIVSWQEIKLAVANPFLQLLEQIRDEAHRFAKKYHLWLRRKT